MLQGHLLAALAAPMLAAQLGDITQGAQVEDPAVVQLGADQPLRRGLTLDGFGFLVSKTPVDSPPDLDLLLLQANGSLTNRVWALNASLRLRLDQLTPPTWDKTVLLFQEIYGSWRLDERLRVKAGKIYQRLGREWDYSFSGPLLFNTDIKMRPHIGVSVEGKPQLGGGLDLAYAAQFFAIDGEAFSALGHSKGISNLRQRTAVVLNVAPGLAIADRVCVRADLSAKVARSLSYDLDPAAGNVEAKAAGEDGRGGVDGVVRTITGNIGAQVYNAGIFLEAGRQFDDSSSISSSDPVLAGRGILPAYTFVWAATKYRIGATTLRLSYNDTFYRDGTRDTLWTPGVTVHLNDIFDLNGEFNLWRTQQPNQQRRDVNPRFRDRSVYVVLVATI